MNKSLILVSRKPIVIQIFTLVCKKLNIQLEIFHEAQIDHKVDILVIDSEFIDDRFNILKSYTKLMGAISKEELPFGSANDFTIPLPFLPSSLEQILDEQLQVLNKRNNSKMYISNVEVEDEDIEESSDDQSQELEPAVEYLESLADDIANEVEEEDEDDSIISFSALNQGGVLDNNELSNIKNLMTPYPEKDRENSPGEKIDTEWMDLSTIIDKAINEVNAVNDMYSKFDNKPIKVLLNNFELDELTPLLNKLDQDIIDSLTDGYEINLQIKLGQTEGE